MEFYLRVDARMWTEFIATPRRGVPSGTLALAPAPSMPSQYLNH